MRPILPAISLALLLGAAPALAGDPNEAETLFNRGLAALEAKQYEEACPALEKSYMIDPLPGVLFTLAECERMRGRLAVAAARYDEYLTLYTTLPPAKKAKQGDRDKKSREQRAALSSKIAELTLVLPPSAPKGTEVTRDGLRVPESALGVPIPVDPGEHVIVAKAPDSTVTETRVKLAPGEKKGFPIEVRLAVAPNAPIERPAASPADERGPNKFALIVGGAVGGAGIVIGAVLLGVSASKGGTITDLAAKVKSHGCPTDPTKATGDCAELSAAINGKATLGNAGLWTLVGGGVIGVATIIYGVAGGGKVPPKSTVRVLPVVTVDGGGLVALGAF